MFFWLISLIARLCSIWSYITRTRHRIHRRFWINPFDTIKLRHCMTSFPSHRFSFLEFINFSLKRQLFVSWKTQIVSKGSLFISWRTFFVYQNTKLVSWMTFYCVPKDITHVLKDKTRVPKDITRVQKDIARVPKDIICLPKNTICVLWDIDGTQRGVIALFQKAICHQSVVINIYWFGTTFLDHQMYRTITQEKFSLCGSIPKAPKKSRTLLLTHLMAVRWLALESVTTKKHLEYTGMHAGENKHSDPNFLLHFFNVLCLGIIIVPNLDSTSLSSQLPYIDPLVQYSIIFTSSLFLASRVPKIFVFSFGFNCWIQYRIKNIVFLLWNHDFKNIYKISVLRAQLKDLKIIFSLRVIVVRTLHIFLILHRKRSITFHCNWVWQIADIFF